MADVTNLLRRWGGGDQDALEELMAAVYGELRLLARSHFRGEGKNLTLQPTALVNELYMRLVDQRQVDFRDRRHFYAVSSLLMRRYLLDHARRRKARRRELHVELPDELRDAAGLDVDMVALHDVLRRLEEEHPRESRVVELRCFGGLSIEETADELGVATGTVKRDWRFARNWLYHELTRA